MQTIDTLVLIFESYYSECFVKDLINYNSNSVILLYNPKKVWVEYKPSDYKINKYVLPYWLCGNNNLYYFLPILLAIDILRLFKFFLIICLRWQVKTVVIDNNYIASLVGILRKIRLIKKQIYLVGDWLPGSKMRGKIWSNLGNNFAFPLADFMACKFSDLVLNNTREISKRRFHFWGRHIPKKEVIFKYRLEIKARLTSLNQKKKNIVFIGSVRQDCGLEVVISCLNRLARQFGMSLIVIGGSYLQYHFLHNIIRKNGVNKHIKFLGFLEREKIKEIFEQCFCGINLLTSTDSYTTRGYPGKIYDYLQYILPIIATEGIGPTSGIIEKNKLGLIIKPKSEDFLKAVIKIYKNQRQFRQNIINFLNLFESSDIKKYLEI